MRRLIDDLLTYARVTTRARAFTATRLDDVLDGVLSDLEVRIEQVGGRIERNPLCTIDADSLQMQQLFQNLVANALKFHRPGVAPIVRIGSKLEGDRCVITVADNGIGFDEKYLDKIFTIFQRLHGKQEYEGTGVGLAVCRRIVDRHGGTIHAHSRVGQGAGFTVTLPAHHGSEA
jgi:light-regulated signal transduction histidine kinase (bacteriophytochrome)